MANEGKTTVTPRLRFPEFREVEGWKTERMGELYLFVRNNALSRDKLNYESGTVKNIHYGDIHTKFSALFDITKERVPYINSTEELPDANSEDYCVEGDVIFADASEDTNDVGKSIEITRLNDERLLSGQHTILARQKDNALIVGFGGHLFQSGKIRSQIQKESQGTKVYAISSTRLSNIEISYPNDEAEQQKIADCLTSLDEVISAQGQKVEALKTYKKGLMQQLFPREGETVPRLRFPEFSGMPQWKEKPLEALLSPVVREMEKPVEPYTGLGVRSHGKGTFLKPHETPEKNSMEYLYEVHTDDLIVNITFAWEGAIAIAQTIDNGALVSHRFPTYTFKKENVLPEFFRYSILDKQLFYQIGVISPGGAGRNRVLNKRDFLKLTRFVPLTTEQQKIANCLSSLDAQISTETEKLSALKTHKKGLMQQLFPVLNEAQE